MNEVTTTGKPKTCEGRPAVNVGDKWNMLTILAEAGRDKWGQRLVLCRCVCKTEKVYAANVVRRGSATSCGICSRHKRPPHPNWKTKNGLNQTPEEAARRNLYVHYKTKAKKHSQQFTLTDQQFFALTKMACVYCGGEPTRLHCRNKRAAHKVECKFNGIDRLDSKIGYTFNNTVPCCWACNTAKSAMTVPQFAYWICQTYAHFAKDFTSCRGELEPAVLSQDQQLDGKK